MNVAPAGADQLHRINFAARPEDQGANIVIFEFYDAGRRELVLLPAGWDSARSTLKLRIPGGLWSAPLAFDPQWDICTVVHMSHRGQICRP